MVALKTSKDLAAGVRLEGRPHGLDRGAAAPHLDAGGAEGGGGLVGGHSIGVHGPAARRRGVARG